MGCGDLGNLLGQATGNAAEQQQEMQWMMRGKNSQQQSIIKFFYGVGGGCTSSGMTAQEYEKLVRDRLSKLDTKQMALNKLGIDEEEVQEITPVSFSGYIFNDDKVDNLAARGSGNTWISSEYMVTWLFFSDNQIFVYQYSFNMTSDSKKEQTLQYFYQDVTNFRASSETYQKVVAETSGCLGQVSYRTVSVDVDEFGIIVPGDKLRCFMTPDEYTDSAIRGMSNKLSEKKNR